MEKKQTKNLKLKMLPILAAVFAMLFGMGANAETIKFNYKATLYKSSNTHVTASQKTNGAHRVFAMTGKPTNLKSSNKKVMTVKAETTTLPNGTVWTNIIGTSKKAGTTTVSFKANGNTYKIKVTVKKYENPIKYIKIGNVTIPGSKFATSANYKMSFSKIKNTKAKVTVKFNDGWRLSSNGRIGYFSGTEGSTYKYYNNGKKIKFTDGTRPVLCIEAVSQDGRFEMLDIIFKK